MKYQILLLCKEKRFYSSLLTEFFKKQNIAVKQILDFPCINKIEEHSVCFDDADLIRDGFINFNGLGFIKYVKNPSAWDKSFYYLRDNQEFDYYYIIEDDVFTRDFETFISLFKKMNNYDADLIACDIGSSDDFPNWWFWDYELTYPIEKRYKSLNCLCRVSNRLVSKVLEIRQGHGSFMFHESIFPSACVNNGMTYLDFKKVPDLRDFFYRFNHIRTGSMVPKGKITHAVKL